MQPTVQQPYPKIMKPCNILSSMRTSAEYSSASTTPTIIWCPRTEVALVTDRVKEGSEIETALIDGVPLRKPNCLCLSPEPFPVCYGQLGGAKKLNKETQAGASDKPGPDKLSLPSWSVSSVAAKRNVQLSTKTWPLIRIKGGLHPFRLSLRKCALSSTSKMKLRYLRAPNIRRTSVLIYIVLWNDPAQIPDRHESWSKYVQELFPAPRSDIPQ